MVRDTEGVDWTLDIWFVDEPDRQPDLEHLRTISPRITPEVQERILRLKRATGRRRSDGTPLPSFEIYQAVLEHNVREVSDLRELTEAST